MIDCWAIHDGALNVVPKSIGDGETSGSAGPKEEVLQMDEGIDVEPATPAPWAEAFSIRKTKYGMFLVKLGPNNKQKYILKAAKELGKHILVSGLEPRCSLDILDLNCLIENWFPRGTYQVQVVEGSKDRYHFCEVSKQKLTVMKIADQSAKKLLTGGKSGLVK